MSRIHAEYPDSDPSDLLVAADILLRQEPDEHEEEEEEEEEEEDVSLFISVGEWPSPSGMRFSVQSESPPQAAPARACCGWST